MKVSLMIVLHFLKSSIYSGAEHVVCTMIHNMPTKDKGYYVSPDGVISQRLKEEGIEHIVIKKLDVRTVKRIVEDIQPDVVHAHDFTASIVVAFSCKNMYLNSGKKIKIISHIHCNPAWMQSINAKTLLYHIATHWMDCILVVSNAIKNEYIFRERLLCPMVEIGNPFSISEIKRVYEKNLDKDKIIKSDILFVGRLSRPKNPLEFIRIIDELNLQRKMVNKKVIMIGDGELKNACKEEIKERKLGEIIEMIGFQKNPYSYMASTQVVVMPSQWEGFGLVALEAMTFGKPVVCSGVGGLSGIVNDSCGKIVEETKAYINEIAKLLEDNEYYKIKSNGARKRAEQFDNVNEYMSELYKIYNN